MSNGIEYSAWCPVEKEVHGCISARGIMLLTQINLIISTYCKVYIVCIG